MNQYKNHQELVEKIIGEFYKHFPDFRIWKNASGVGYGLGGGIVRFGLKGSADLIGLTNTGRFLAIEAKTGKAKQSEDQKNFESMIKKLGGLYVLIKDSDDVIKKLVEGIYGGEQLGRQI